jgi:hypothetical protein
MNKQLERLMTGSILLAALGLVIACLWFLIKIDILHWLILFAIASWVVGTIVKKWGFKDDEPRP